MNISKYYSAYTAIYRKTLENCLSRRWLFALSGVCFAINSMMSLIIYYLFFGPAAFDVLTGDKEKTMEAYKHYFESDGFFKMPWGIMGFLLVTLGQGLFRMALDSFVEGTIYQTLLKSPNPRKSLWGWFIQSGRKYFGAIFY